MMDKMPSQRYRILVLGDLEIRESHTGPATHLPEFGRGFGSEDLVAYAEHADAVIASLTAPLIDLDRHGSPTQEIKEGIRWADATATSQALQDLGVEAVSLANSHTLDLGVNGLTSTVEALAKVGISGFGAGEHRSEADRPYRVILPARVGGGEVLFHASLQSPPGHEGAGSKETEPGCASSSPSAVVDPQGSRTGADTFHVAFPRWGKGHTWRSTSQHRIAEHLLDHDYDLILGHGPHSVQEVLRSRRRWSVYSIGAGDARASERHRSRVALEEAPPISFWTILEVALAEDATRSVCLRLYPVKPGLLNAEPRPVTSDDFDHLVAALSTRSVNGWGFDNPARATDRDELGWHLRLDLGHWSVGERPALCAGLLDGIDPDEAEPFRIYHNIRRGVDRFPETRHLGASLNAEAAQAHGAHVNWISSRVAVAQTSNLSLLIDGYTAQESSLGAAITKDKYLTSQILQAAGVDTPEMGLASSAAEARRVAARIGGPVVIKPSDGALGKGVSVNVQDEEDITAAFDRASAEGRTVMVEACIDIDQELRVMASATECVAITERVLPQVTGDGLSTIEQLIQERNQVRATIFSLRGKDTPVDALTRNTLAQAGFTLQDILERGVSVTVRDVGGQSSGGDIAERSHAADETVRRTAVAAVRAVPGLQWAGVDMLIQRGTSSIYVIEINTKAGYGSATFPSYGTPQDVAGAAWRLRLQNAQADGDPVPDLLRRPKSALLMRTRESRAARLRHLPHISGEDSTLSQHFFTYARHRGLNVTQVSSRVRRLEAPDGAHQLMTARGLTEKDLSVVGTAMGSARTVRSLLREAGISRVPSRYVSTTKQLENFLGARQGLVRAMPANRPWAGPKSRILNVEEASELDPALGWLMQVYPEGNRLRVLTTRDRAMAVLSTTDTDADADADGTVALSRRRLRSASMLAIEAVRAVPQLRWAAVDLLARPTRELPPRKEELRVEGMSLSPRIGQSDQLLAGSLTAFFDWLIDS